MQARTRLRQVLGLLSRETADCLRTRKREGAKTRNPTKHRGRRDTENTEGKGRSTIARPVRFYLSFSVISVSPCPPCHAFVGSLFRSFALSRSQTVGRWVVH